MHLLRELKNVTKYKNKTGDWCEFSKKLKRILRDGIRLCGKRSELAATTFEQLRNRIELRLSKLLQQDLNNVEAKRLVKRMKRHRKKLF
ncbi:MAG: hypothetical protein LBC74_02280 [Planctomycetaceae bacterium]|jgi:hypothetical protein|nr:hypothetical protein [Planctomycetaceae bacterium]